MVRRADARSSDQPSGPGRLRAALLGVLAAVVLVAVWIPLHPARPLQPTADVTTHLSVARHLVRGEGFKTDVAYPLSFAFEFARELPQPLIHRQPGFAVLLTAPVAATGADPVRSVTGARVLQIGLFAATALVGAFALLRRRRGLGIPAFLVLLGANPLAAFAIDWIFVEIITALVLLALWLRGRDDGVPGPIDGVLAGLLTLLRLDLFWVPILWWILAGGMRRSTWRRWAIAGVVWLAVLTPWMVRTQALTGQPFFSLQAFAEHAKDTRDWPLYSVYQQLEPQPLLRTITENPVPLMRKVARGVEFFLKDLGGFIPLPVVFIILVAMAGAIVRGRQPGDDPGRPRAGPLCRTGITLAALILQYAFFDHSLRHLLVLLPILAWESAVFLTEAFPGHRWAPAALAALMVAAFPCRLPGWETAAADAVAAIPETEARVERFRDRTEPVLFVPDGTIPWRLDRPGVWNPGDEQVKEEIRSLITDGVDSP